MSKLVTLFGGASHNWMQHHMPWLAVLALVMGFEHDEPQAGDFPDEGNG